MDEDYDVVTDVLKKHLNVLLEMINSSDKGVERWKRHLTCTTSRYSSSLT